MTDCFWLEFDPDKLAILKQEAYELDLSLEEYLSEMLEDMVSFNREKTEDEANMDKYKTIKWKLKEPNKKNYDLNKFSGIKKYVNDCIKYKAAAEYGITKIIYDDTADPWDGYGWDIPAEYIPNIEYYKEHTDPILPAGFRTTADELVSESYCALYMMVEEWKAQGETNEDIAKYASLVVTWKELGGGNYQLYIMW